MPQGEFKLVVQAGQVGYYAEIVLDVQRSPQLEGIAIQFAPSCEIRYRAAAQFGIEYAWEYTPRELKGNTGLAVEIVTIRWAAVDTTSVLVAYAAAEALWKAISHTPRRPIKLDTEARGIFFPR